MREYAKSVVSPGHLAADLNWLAYDVIEPSRLRSERRFKSISVSRSFSSCSRSRLALAVNFSAQVNFEDLTFASPVLASLNAGRWPPPVC